MNQEVVGLGEYLVVAGGAGLGGLARYLVGTWIMTKYLGRFPLGTFIVNVSGAFLIGVIMTLLARAHQPHPNVRLFLVVGILGGYTTFSAFEYDVYQSVRAGERWVALLYVVSSVVLGYIGVWLGEAVTRR